MPDQDPLAQLRDIHLPNAISAWPPAPGWWILALLSIATLVGISLWLWRWINANRYRKLALKALNSLDQQQPTHYLQQLNSLLKQTALAASPHSEDIAKLSGQQWLQFLDHSASTKDFQQGIGKVLADGPYAVSIENINTAPLHQLAQRWIKQHKPKSFQMGELI